MTQTPDNTDFPTISGSGGEASQDGLYADRCDYHLGDRIGPYRLLNILGEGGLGRVYLAQQDDPIRRQVALKIVKPGMNSKESITRFEAERQS